MQKLSQKLREWVENGINLQAPEIRLPVKPIRIPYALQIKRIIAGAYLIGLIGMFINLLTNPSVDALSTLLTFPLIIILLDYLVKTRNWEEKIKKPKGGRRKRRSKAKSSQ